MKFFPYNRVRIETDKSKEQVLEILRKNTDPYPSFCIETSQYPFRGKIAEDTFTLHRTILYNNSFLPLIKGRITEDNITIVDVVMRLHAVIAVFMFVWLGSVGAVCFLVLMKLILGRQFEPLLLLPYLMFAFGYTLMTLPFQLEANKAKTANRPTQRICIENKPHRNEKNLAHNKACLYARSFKHPFLGAMV